jgi:hypothetical protein
LKDNKHYPGPVWKKIFAAAGKGTKQATDNLELKWQQQQPKQQQQQQQQKQQVPLRLTGKQAVLLDYCSEQWQYCQLTACHSNCGFFTVQNVVTQDIIQLCPKHVREQLGDKWLNEQKGKI